jgi:hypothetical protein
MRSFTAYNYAVRISTTRALDHISLRLEQIDDAIAVVALYLNDTVFHRAAAAASSFQLLA